MPKNMRARVRRHVHAAGLKQAAETETNGADLDDSVMNEVEAAISALGNTPPLDAVTTSGDDKRKSKLDKRREKRERLMERMQ